MLGEAIAHPSSVKRFFPIRPNQGRRIVHGAEARVFARAQAHVDAPVRHLLVADDQDVGDFCQLRLADLEAYSAAWASTRLPSVYTTILR